MAVETAADFGAAPAGKAARWHSEIRAFEREREPWEKRVCKIEERYRDEKKRDDAERRFALLWANLEVLQPALYAKDPKPEVSRRFKDRDPVGKLLGLVIERNLSLAIEENEGAFGRTMRAAVKDFLLGGQGTAWARYEVEMAAGDDDEGEEGDGTLAEVGGDEDEPGPDDDDMDAPGMGGPLGMAPAPGGGGLPPAMPGIPGAAPAGAEMGPPIPVASQEWARFEFVHRRDFGFTAGARVWDEVGAVWRRSFLTRDALVKRFGEDMAKRIPLDCKAPDGTDEKMAQTFAKATIYEVWDSSERQTAWVHLSVDELLDEKPYPLEISGRFPCPEPLFGTMTNDNLIPVPDFAQYQDQANEMDALTGRISALTKALRLVGLIPGDMSSTLQKALDLEGESRLMPVPGWAAMGGQKMSDLILWLPIQEVAATIEKLQGIRAQLKADAYEITGLSDILRGSSQASETATAQQLKAQWGSVRVRTRQQSVQRFAAQGLRLLAEIMVGHFDVPRLLERANVAALSQQEQQLIPQVAALLEQRQIALVHHRVDVETDSTIEADASADKQAWSELLQGIAGFFGAMAPILQQMQMSAPVAAPAMAAMMGELLTSAVRRFKAGPAVESSIEAAFDAIGQAAQQPPPMMGNGGAMMQMKQQEMQQQAANDQQQIQAEQQRTAADMAKHQDESQHRTADRQIEVARLQLDAHKAIAEHHRAQNPPPPRGN